MKFYSLLLVFSIFSNAQISATQSLKLEGFIFERVSYDKGENWEPALCHHIKLGKRGINCEVNLTEMNQLRKNVNRDKYRFEAHSHGRFNSSYVAESGEIITEIVDFSGNAIKLNGRIVALMKDGITSVSLFIPDVKLFIVLHAGEAVDNNSLDGINEIASRISQITSPAMEVKAFPNPLTGNNLNLKSNIPVFKTVIYDSTGRPLLTDYEVWNTQRSFSLDGFPPGNYLIECHSGDPGKSPSALIKILKQ
jgi:hypothetical protein